MNYRFTYWESGGGFYGISWRVTVRDDQVVTELVSATYVGTEEPDPPAGGIDWVWEQTLMRLRTGQGRRAGRSM